MEEMLHTLQSSTQWYNNGWLELFIFSFTVIGAWKMFGEFGEKKWKSLIPIYNEFILFKNVWSTKAYWIYFIMSFISSGFVAISEYMSLPMVVEFLLLIAALVMTIIEAIYWIRFVLYLNKAYEYPLWIGIVAIIVRPFVIILYAFGKNRYSGNKSQE